MTKTYEKRLVELAKEVMRLQAPRAYMVGNKTQEEIKMEARFDDARFNSTLSHLLGFIMALDDSEQNIKIGNPFPEVGDKVRKS